MRTYTYRDILPLLKYGPLDKTPTGQNWPARLQLIPERLQEQGDTNYRLLNIQTVSQAAEYPSQDAKQEQGAARQPKECQTNGKYLTQSTAIQGQSVRQQDESLPFKAACTTRLSERLLNNVVQSIKAYLLHMSGAEHTFSFFFSHTVLTVFYWMATYFMKRYMTTRHD